jgi:hypothetical protein
MLKEILIVLGAIGSIFLIIPLSWFYTCGLGSIAYILPFLLLIVVLGYAGFDIKKMRNNGKHRSANHFLKYLVAVIAISFVTLIIILPYVTPKFYV